MEGAQCSVVLDTNVLHCVKLYLSYAEGKRRYPYKGVEWSVTQAYIKNSVKEQEVRDALFCGGRVICFMQRNGVELVRCSAVEAEFFRLEAFSRGLRTAIVRSRVRGRWFSKFGDDDVNLWMTREDRQCVVASLDEAFERLDVLGIRVSDLTPASSSAAVWLARGIMTIVYMDAMDSVVYANALVAFATHLVTRDGPLRGLVNRFKNPLSPDAKADSEALSALVEEGTGVKVAHRDFPVSQNISGLCP